MFNTKKWSCYKIARLYCRARVEDWAGWTEQGIAKLLANPDAIGVHIYNRTSKEMNYETGKREKKANPHSEWEVYYDPDLAIISIQEWRRTKKRLAKIRPNKRTKCKTPSRNQISATTLFSGTLFCDSCGAELKLIRSTKKYKMMGCLNGSGCKHGCQLKSSKSTRIVEQSLLDYLTDVIFTEERLAELFQRANRFIAEEAARPREDVAPLKASLRRHEKSIENLFSRLDRTNDSDLMDAYDKQIAKTRKDIRKLQKQLRDMEVSNRQPPRPLDQERAKFYAGLLAELLQQEIPAAADAIRSLTGKIHIRQEQVPGRKHGARWIAHFSPDLVQFLRHLSKDNHYPDSKTLEYLCAGNWIIPEEVTIDIEKVHASQLNQTEILRLSSEGQSISTIAAAVELNVETVTNVLKLANGEPARSKTRNKPDQRGKPSKRRITYRDIMDEVVHRRDELGESFGKIADDLGHGTSMVKRAWDAAHPEVIQEAIAKGEPPRRATNSRMGKAKKDRIAKLIEEGTRPCDIVAQVGCSRSTVTRTRKRMNEPGFDSIH